jgi:hypothetical protein
MTRKPTKAIGTGVLRAGHVTWDNARGFTRDLCALGDGSVVVTAKLASAATVRSEQANAYYWGQVLTPMSQAASAVDQSPEDIHDAMCALFLPHEHKRVDFFNRLTGERLPIEVDARRSSKLGGRAFYEFVERVRKFALEFLGVETADPDPAYWRGREAA